jgi:hypothetical protein
MRFGQVHRSIRQVTYIDRMVHVGVNRVDMFT